MIEMSARDSLYDDRRHHVENAKFLARFLDFECVKVTRLGRGERFGVVTVKFLRVDW